MPAATLSPAAVLVESFFREFTSMPQSYGDDGRSVSAAAREAALHWQARPSCSIEMIRIEDPFSYDPVPMKILGTAKVKYRIGGRLPPSPYSTDR